MLSPPQGIEPAFLGSRAYIGPSGDTTGAKDTTNINNALNLGKRVELSSGSYYTNNALIVNKSNTQLVGQGRELTAINFVGSATAHNGIDVSAAATSANDGTATPLAPSTALSGLRFEGFNLIMNDSYINYASNEQTGTGIYMIGTRRSRVVDVGVSGFTDFGIAFRSGAATGNDAVASRDNIAADCIVITDGYIGFYDDSVNTFGVGGGTNPTPNRNNRFLRDTAYRTSKYGTIITNACGFSTFGTWGAKFESCHAEGHQFTTGSVAAGFIDQGAAWSTVFTDCSSIENWSGILLGVCNHAKVHGFHSWFDANFGILIGALTDVVVEESMIDDTGIAAVTSGFGIYINPSQVPGGTTADRITIRDVHFGVSGYTASKIYAVAGNPIGPFKFNSNTEVNTFSNVFIDGCRATGWSSNLINTFVAGTLIHNIIVRNCYGFNPLGLLANPFDNTNNFIGFPGVSATLTSAKVYTCTIAPIDIMWTGGTVTAQAKNGTGIPQAVAGPNTIHLEPGDTYSITFSVTPTTFDVYQS